MKFTLVEMCRRRVSTGCVFTSQPLASSRYQENLDLDCMRSHVKRRRIEVKPELVSHRMDLSVSLGLWATAISEKSQSKTGLELGSILCACGLLGV